MLHCCFYEGGEVQPKWDNRPAVFGRAQKQQGGDHEADDVDEDDIFYRDDDDDADEDDIFYGDDDGVGCN